MPYKLWDEYTKTDFGRYVGKVILIKLPRNKNPRWRWIVRKKGNRFIVRTPKFRTLIRNLDKKRSRDYGKETLLPLGATHKEGNSN